MTGEMRKAEVIVFSEEVPKVLNVISATSENGDHHPLFSGQREGRNLRLHSSVKRGIQDDFCATQPRSR